MKILISQTGHAYSQGNAWRIVIINIELIIDIYDSVQHSRKRSGIRTPQKAKINEERENEPIKQQSDHLSLSEFWNDGQFIEFLKNIAWFCGERDNDSAVERLGPYKILYQNLSGLRDEFKKYNRMKNLNVEIEPETEQENDENLLKYNEYIQERSYYDDQSSDSCDKVEIMSTRILNNQKQLSTRNQSNYKNPIQNSNKDKIPKKKLKNIPKMRKKLIFWEFLDNIQNNIKVDKRVKKETKRNTQKKSKLIREEGKT